MGHTHDWLAYLAGALSALFAKWWYWQRTGKGQGKTLWVSTKEWLSLDLLSDQVSWLATIAIVWCGGYMYMSRIGIGWDFIDKLPVAVPFAFLLGILMEYVAPNLFKWLVKKFSMEGD